MSKIYVNATDDIQTIIDASNPGDILYFNPGIYRLEKTLQLKSDRSYVARNRQEAIFAGALLPMSLIRRASLWFKRHVLRKNARPDTITVSPMLLCEGENVYIDGFTIWGSGGTGVQIKPPNLI